MLLDQALSWHEWISVGPVGRSFEMGEERNASTWFSVLQATLAALTVFGIYYAARVRGASRRTLRGWLVVGCFFAYIGLDEAATLHENLGAALRDSVGNVQRVGFAPLRWLLQIETHDWLLFLLPLFAAMGLFVSVFLWKQLERDRLRKFLVLGMGCFVLAVLMDFFQGRENFFWDLGSLLYLEELSLAHHWAVVEETLEMFGTTMFWQGFLRYLAGLTDGRTLRFARVDAGS